MDSLKKIAAKLCIKLLTNDRTRTWFITNVLREVDLDDVITMLREAKPEKVTCPKCGHEFEKK